MNCFASASTDIGIIKKTNQDSICIKIADFIGSGQIVLGVICDGMGGLAKGEVASASLIRRFCDWYEKELPTELNSFSWEKLGNRWIQMIREQNEKLLQYGRESDVELGTTLSGILIMDGQYLIVHVGDSRIYLINDSLKQLTEDQTFVHREVEAGRMTAEEAAINPKRNMLLQCVGASRVVNPVIYTGSIPQNAVFMLCSDGFRHVLTNEEILDSFKPSSLNSIEIMKEKSENLIEIIKKRNERDNITVGLINTIV